MRTAPPGTAKQASNYGALSVRSGDCLCGAVRVDRQVGLESTPEAFVATMVEGFREVRRVLRKDGTCWVNLGDSYAGSGKGPPGRDGFQSEASHMSDIEHDQAMREAIGMPPLDADMLATYRQGNPSDKSRSNRGSQKYALVNGGKPPSGLKPKDLMGMPWRVAFALQADGWYLRSDIIWSKPNPMPESVNDRPTRAHEYLFLLSKSRTYFYDADAIREPLQEKWSENGKLRSVRDGIDTNGGGQGNGHMEWNPAGRNKRSVWEIATSPFSEWGETSRRVDVPLDAVDGDTKRTLSPDCPLHAFRDHQDSNPLDGGRAGVSEVLPHNPGTYSGRGAAQRVGRASTAPLPEPNLSACTTDFQHQPCAGAATPHNSESHKTDRAPATTRPYTPSAEMPLGISHIPASLDSVGAVDHNAENSTSAGSLRDDSVLDRGAQTQPRSAGRCTCSYYKDITEKTSHFATFPPALVEPCIKAGTSEKGCCPVCGAPIVRQTTTEYVKSPVHGTGSRMRNGAETTETNGWAGMPRVARRDTTTGWGPSCAHPEAAQPVPCTVLDPFGGAGTTALVADRLGRSAILIELNPVYAAMAQARLIGDSPMFTEVVA